MLMANKKELPKRKQVRDWAKQHAIKKQRALSKDESLSLLTQHHNELLARFFGIKTFSGQVAEKVNRQLEAQWCGEQQ